MKTTIELPDQLLKRAKRFAALRNRTFKDLMIEALRRIVAEAEQSPLEPEWRRCFGRFRGSQDETREIQSIIERDLSIVDLNDWK